MSVRDNSMYGPMTKEQVVLLALHWKWVRFFLVLSGFSCVFACASHDGFRIRITLLDSAHYDAVDFAELYFHGGPTGCIRRIGFIEIEVENEENVAEAQSAMREQLASIGAHAGIEVQVTNVPGARASTAEKLGALVVGMVVASSENREYDRKSKLELSDNVVSHYVLSGIAVRSVSCGSAGAAPIPVAK